MSRHAMSKGRIRGWTFGDIQELRRLARKGTAEAAAGVLGRSVVAVRMKAMKCGISFRPVQPAAVRAKE